MNNLLLMTDIDWKLFGALIKKKRQERGLSLDDAADMMRIGRTRLYDIENGHVKYFVRENNLNSIISFYDLSDDEIPYKDPGKVNDRHVTYGLDDITLKVMQLMKDMPDEKRQEILRYTEKEKLIEDLLKKQKKKTG